MTGLIRIVPALMAGLGLLSAVDPGSVSSTAAARGVFTITDAGGPTEDAQAWADPDRELMVPVPGGRVYVRVNGDLETAEKPPAVFIHGGPGGTHLGFAALLGLANERPLVLYDQLGSGKSDRPDDPRDWRVERYVDELDAVRAALDIATWHLVGSSWGSAVALEYAVRFPARVASIVLGGTFISTTHWITDANLLLAELSPEDRALVTRCETPEPPPAADCQAAFSKVYSRYYRRAPRSEAATRYAERHGGRGSNPLIYNRMWGPSEFKATGLLQNYDATLKLRELAGPRTLFLIGQYDSARIDTVQEFVALTPGAELAVVPGASHGYIFDRPLETEAILRGWLRRMDPP